MNTKIILIMGLPGSGKTTLSKELLNHIDAEHFEADVIRQLENDWDFSEEGRMRQVYRMRELALKSNKAYVICDFVCPLVEGREILQPDIIIWMNTIEKGRFEDTNKAFVEPENVDYLITDYNAELHSEVISRTILETAEQSFDTNLPTTQMLGRFQPFHDGHLALFEKCHEQTGQVVIMVRDTPRGIKDPFDFKTVKQNIQLYLLGEGYEENHDYIIMKVPNIVDISYGRDVGYSITQHKFDKDVEDISATEIRRQIGIEKS